MVINNNRLTLRNIISTSARLAQSVEHETLNLRVVGSSPTLGEIFLFFNNNKISCERKLQMQFWYQCFAKTVKTRWPWWSQEEAMQRANLPFGQIGACQLEATTHFAIWS